MPDPSFGSRVHSALSEYGPLCVGIDPHPFLLEQWNLPDSALGLREFGLRVVEAAVGRVAVLKPQVAFFERHGSAGFAALEQVLVAARQRGVLVIADAKRGDVGSSLEAYAQAWLSPGSGLEVDAMTVSAYQGVGSLSDAIDLARKNGKGMFVLGATSNPEASQVQLAQVQHERSGTARGVDESVAAHIVNDVVTLNVESGEECGSFGVVLGATIALTDYGVSLAALSSKPITPILAPGFGHQGARFSQIVERFGAHSGLLVSASRSILVAGPSGIVSAINNAKREIAECRE